MKPRTRRIYEDPDPDDGPRVLIDRLWPRGVSKEDAKIDYWARSIAPSSELRKWYQHDPAKWKEFRKRYFAELDANPEGVEELLDFLGGRSPTLVFSSKEERLNNAAAMSEYLEKVS